MKQSKKPQSDGNPPETVTKQRIELVPETSLSEAPESPDAKPQKPEPDCVQTLDSQAQSDLQKDIARRRKRIHRTEGALGAPHYNLRIDPRDKKPGYTYRMVKIQEKGEPTGRAQERYARGWEPLKSARNPEIPENINLPSAIGSHGEYDGKNGDRLIPMGIPTVLLEEAEKAKNMRRDQRDTAIKEKIQNSDMSASIPVQYTETPYSGD